MSRSKPDEHAPNPATRWFEWNGEKGLVRYYDKDARQQVDVGADFTFILLDELGSVRGWHDASSSGIYSNEVRDTRQDAMVVKAFKGGTLAEGLYADIKDRVHSVGGQFVANCYIAWKNGNGELSIGSIRFKGASLGAWMEFRKAHRAELYTKAVKIDGVTEGQKGRIVYKMPVFKVVPLSDATNKVATGLDAVLQKFLDTYLARNKRDQVDTTPEYEDEPPPRDTSYDEEKLAGAGMTEDDIPF